MRRHFASALLGLLLAIGTVAGLSTVPVALSQGKSEQKEVIVWVNTNSSVYHCPGSRWYGKTKQGKFVGECAARKDGNRPAYGKPCGSDCR